MKAKTYVSCLPPIPCCFPTQNDIEIIHANPNGIFYMSLLYNIYVFMYSFQI